MRFAKVGILVLGAAVFLTGCGSQAQWIVSDLKQEQMVDDVPPGDIAIDSDISSVELDDADFRLLGRDGDGNSYFVAQRSPGGRFCLLGVAAGGDNSGYACGESLPFPMKLTLQEGQLLQITLHETGAGVPGAEQVSDQLSVELVNSGG